MLGQQCYFAYVSVAYAPAYNGHMEKVLASRLSHAPGRTAPARRPLALAVLFVALSFAVSGCHPAPLLDTKPLDTAGMTYDAIQQLKALQITAPDIAQLVEARQAGLSDAACVAVLKIYRGRNQVFDAGDALAGLVRVGVSEDNIMELARINQLGLGAGELQAMKLAGLSDDILLEVARHRAAGQPVLAGASLADLKNVGVRGSTLLELARRGVPDSQAAAIVSFRRHGATDAAILSHFGGSK
jgi:hypothetical protein